MRPSSKLLMIAGTTLALLATAVRATPVPPLPVMQYEPIEAQRAMDRFARCIVDSRGRRPVAERFVRMVPGGQGYGDLGRDLATGECVPHSVAGQVQMRFQPDLFRTALFAALYRADFRRSPPPPTVQTLPPLLLSQEFDGPADALPENIRFMRGFGDCAARRDPGGVHSLLRTRIGSADERQAIEGLGSALGHCLTTEQRLRFSRGVLRGTLAEALYKLRRAASASPAEGTVR